MVLCSTTMLSVGRLQQRSRQASRNRLSQCLAVIFVSERETLVLHLSASSDKNKEVTSVRFDLNVCDWLDWWNPRKTTVTGQTVTNSCIQTVTINWLSAVFFFWTYHSYHCMKSKTVKAKTFLEVWRRKQVMCLISENSFLVKLEDGSSNYEQPRWEQLLHAGWQFDLRQTDENNETLNPALRLGSQPVCDMFPVGFEDLLPERTQHVHCMKAISHDSPCLLMSTLLNVAHELLGSYLLIISSTPRPWSGWSSG